MSGAVEPSDPHPPYSPSHAEYTPDSPSVLPPHRTNPPEYTPDFPYAHCGRPLSPVPASVQEPGGQHAQYSPQPLPSVLESDETAVQDDDSHMLYDPASPSVLVDEPISSTPPYVSRSPNPDDQEAATFSFYPSFPLQTGEFQCPEHGPSSRPVPIHSSESHFRRLTGSRHQWPNRQFRSSLLHDGEKFSFGSLPLPNSEQSECNMLSSQRPSEYSRKHKVIAEDNAAETSQEVKQDKGRCAANFECNICFDMAAEPVVTSCGHLFCWPCLYQWLHLHSGHKECPVCKGEVTESNVTPIYGRGSLQRGAQQNNEDNDDSGFKIPPRPSGNRFESVRQQYAPVSRRLDEELVASWRRLLDQHVRREHRHEANAEPGLQEVSDIVHHRALSRLRARRLQREVNHGSASMSSELGSPANNVPNPIRSTSNSIFRDGVNLLHHLSMHDIGTDRLATISVGNVVGRSANVSSRHGASTFSVNPSNLELPTSAHRVESALGADQASPSSAMAVIQGDVASSEVLAEPNNAGSSLSNRRRVSGTSGPHDVDGSAQPCKRRLN